MSSPQVVDSDGAKIVKLMKAAGAKLDDDQAEFMFRASARDFSGNWASPVIGLSIPRQNGKTFVLVCFCLSIMLIRGVDVVYTAHLQKTATEAFIEMRSIAESPALASRVKRINTALGREEIHLTNGARIKFLARTRTGGRGQHANLLILDEAQEMDDKQLASFLPTLSAQENPLVIYGGTPPDEESPGTVFSRIRDMGHQRESGVLWIEYAIQNPEDAKDEANWYRTNPALGNRMNIDTIRNEYKQSNLERFARERCGWWDETLHVQKTVIDAASWNVCATEHPPHDGLLCYAVKFTTDSRSAVVAVCCKPKDGTPHVEIVNTYSTASGNGAIEDWLLQRKQKAAEVIIDGGDAHILRDELIARGFSERAVKCPKPTEAADSYAALVEAVKARSVTHFNQPALNVSATKTTKRRIGSAGGFGFASTDKADAAFIEAAALAYRAATTTKRNPERKAVIW